MYAGPKFHSVLLNNELFSKLVNSDFHETQSLNGQKHHVTVEDQILARFVLPPAVFEKHVYTEVENWKCTE